MLWVALHLSSLPPGTLKHVAAWACQFTPRVSLEPPRGLLLELEGSLRLFGGLECLIERLREGLDAMELTAQLAVAPVARAALWRARGGGAKLEEVPLEVTGFDSGAFFRNIGTFTVFLCHPKAQSTAVEIGLASPAREAERLWQLLREKLATLSLARPVEAIRLEAGDFSPLHARTAGMFGDALSEDEGWGRLAERLQARLGPGAVYGLATHPDHRPEYSWRRVEPGEWDPREFRHPGPRP